MNSFYVTTPIYYVNDQPHIGHAYTTILADVLSRFHRLLGTPTFFLTGTDEHGQKVQQAAQKAGMTPQEQADRTVVRFQDLWRKLEITHDDFIRTTEPRHKEVVQEILQDLYDRGEIYRAEYDGWYCVPDERFFTEKDLAEGRCPQCGRPVERIREANYFFRQGRHQDWLIEYIESHPDFIQPDFRRNETLGFLRKKLNDLCISRPKSRLSWGIELPFDRDYVCYVWFDALLNYITGIGHRRDAATFARWWPATVQLIGKDILTTHSVYWPIMLKAMGLPLPRTIFAHGWWLTGEAKMSKSLGNVVNPMDMVEKYGVDPFRYFLIAEMTLGQDASFSEEAFVRRYNADLANDLGNLLSRVMKLVQSHCGGRIPEPSAAAMEQPEEHALREAVLAAANGLEEGVRTLRLDAALARVLASVKEVNRYLEVRQPWTLAKQADRGPFNTTMYMAAEALRIAAALFQPVMPARMEQMRRALGLPTGAPDIAQARRWGGLVPGTAIAPSAPLFPRIQEPAPTPAQAGPAAPAAPKKKTAPVGPAESVTYDEFARLDLRTARVLKAEKVPEADKLLRLEIEVGGEPRQIVAGIAKHYAPEQLVGRTIVIVANLAPAKIRGIESRGMLLAASAGEVMRLVTVDGELPSGARTK